jgi:hypothetical protein
MFYSREDCLVFQQSASLRCRRHTRETVSPKPQAFAARQREAVSTLRDLLYVLLANHCRDQDAL